MELYIQIRDGQPHEHPIFGDNFREAFPDVDVNNLPPEFARFERLECPFVPSVFQIVTSEYRWDGDVVKDYWTIRDMTDEEKEEARLMATERVLQNVQRLKVEVREYCEAEQNPHNKQVWQEFITALDAWQLINPFSPNLPRFPIYNDDGELYLPEKLSGPIDVSGSAPNVIG